MIQPHIIQDTGLKLDQNAKPLVLNTERLCGLIHDILGLVNYYGMNHL